MHRFFVESSREWSPGTVVSLSPDDSAHAARVLRLTPGNVIIICDGRGYEYEARLEQVSSRAVTARVTSGRPSTAEPNTHLTLIQGVAKGAKMDLIVQKAVEVGVSRIIPVTTERTVVRLEPAKATARVERWQRIAYEAAKQSGRAEIPVVEAVHAWSDLWPADNQDLVLVPWEGETERGIVAALRSNLTEDNASTVPARIAIAIGPEGGLSDDEVSLARRHGAQAVTLGPRILRTETAGLVAATLVLAAAGDLG